MQPILFAVQDTSAQLSCVIPIKSLLQMFFQINPYSAEFLKFTSYCSLKPLWSGMGEVVPARTSPTLHPTFPPTVHQLSRLAL